MGEGPPLVFGDRRPLGVEVFGDWSRDHYVFEEDNSPTALRASVVSYAHGAYKVLYRQRCRRNF